MTTKPADITDEAPLSAIDIDVANAAIVRLKLALQMRTREVDTIRRETIEECARVAHDVGQSAWVNALNHGDDAEAQRLAELAERAVCIEDAIRALGTRT